MPPEVRTLLVRFQEAIGSAALPTDERDIAGELITYLIDLHDKGKLGAPFLKLALEPFNEVAQVANIVGPLVRYAAHQSAAMGHRDFQRIDTLPWIASSYSDLEPKGVLQGLEGYGASEGPRKPDGRS